MCVAASTAEYFRKDDGEDKNDEVSSKNGYKCVLNSKATEESMVSKMILK